MLFDGVLYLRMPFLGELRKMFVTGGLKLFQLVRCLVGDEVFAQI
jgi:hypothetical protein